MKLRGKIYLFILAAVFLVIFVISLSYHRTITSSTRQLIESKLRQSSNLKAHGIEHYFATLEDELNLAIPRGYSFENLERYKETGNPKFLDELQHNLTHMNEASHIIAEVTMTDTQGKILATTLAGGKSGAPYYSFSGNGTLEDPQVLLEFMKKGEIPYVHSRVPVIDDDGNLDALIFVLAEFDELIAVVSDFSQAGFVSGDTEFVQYTEDGGALFLSPLKYDANSTFVRTLSSSDAQVSVMQAKNYPDGGFLESVDYRNVPVLSYVRYIETYNLGLAVELDTAEIGKIERGYLPGNLIILLILLPLVFLFAFIFVKRLLTPLDNLTDAMASVSGGRFIEVSDAGGDEIGILARAYNEMQSNLKSGMKTIQNEQQRYQALMELATEAIFIFDPESGDLLEYNKRTRELLGYDEVEMDNLNVLDFDKNLGDISEFQAITRSITDSPISIERVHTRKDGSTYIASVVASRIQIHGLQYIYSSARDITEQRENERTIRHQNEVLESAQKAAKLGFWEYDVKQDHLTWSDEVYLIFGVQPQSFEATYEWFLRYVHPDDREMLNKAYADSMEQKTGYKLRHRVLRDDGTIVYVNEVAYHELDEQGEVIRSVGTVQDISDMAAYEQEISAKNRILERAQHTANIGYWNADILNSVVACSDEIYRLLDTDEDHFDGSLEAFYSYVHPEDLPRIQELHEIAMEQKSGYHCRHRLLRRDGTTIPVNVSIDLEFDERGNLIKALGIMQDISEIVGQEEKLRSITDTSPDPIIMMDTDGTIIFWNPAAAHVLGYSAEEALGKHLHSLLAPVRYHQAHQAAFPHFLKTGEGGAVGKTVNLQAIHKDGHEVEVALSIGALRKDQQWQAVAVLRDITEQKINENLITKQKDELETIFQTSLEGISLLNKNREFIFVNERFAQMFGYSETEILTKNCHDFTDPRYHEELDSVLNQVLETGSYEGFERECFTKDGSRRRIKSSIALMPDQERILMTSEDVTEFHDAMEKIRRQAVVDELTQIGNRKAYNERLEKEFKKLGKTHSALSLFIFDIDLFKNINDGYGHLKGDEVLVHIARETSLLGSNDLYRIGGDEFVMILPGVSLHDAAARAESLRVNIQSRVKVADKVCVTISIGVAEAVPSDNPDALLKKADDNLYRAKERGRNCVVAE